MAFKKPLPSSGYLNSMFEYDKRTGILSRVKNIRGRAKRGQVGNLTPNGYLAVGILYSSYLVHRIIWKMVYGYDPIEVDHINGNKSDNRIKNLREVTRSLNNMNAKLRSDNKSGTVGVYWANHDQRWIANIYLNGKFKSLGSFKDKEKAIIARKKAEKKIGCHKNHGRKEPL